MVFRGSGGPPPSTIKRGEGARLGRKPFGFHFYEVLENGKRKKVSRFRVGVDEKDVPFLFLDEALPDIGAAPSVRVHEFKFNGAFGNILLCNSHKDEGCPVDVVFKRESKFTGKVEPMRGTWKWVATGIKMKPFTYTKGPMAGTVVPYQRCMLLVSDKQYGTFEAYREQYADQGGLRGKIFNVRRSNDQRSSKIGETWIPAGSMTDEEMIDKFSEAAGNYGLPVEKFLAPLDYEHVLKELSAEEMLDAAQWIATDHGVQLDLTNGAQAPTPESTVASEEEEDEDHVPF